MMGLVHASALAGAWKSCLAGGPAVEELGGCIALTLSMVFFLLKLGGVSFLRFRTDKRAWVVICLAVALVHIDCIDPNLEGTLASDCTTVLATTTLIGGLTELSKAMRGLVSRVGHSCKLSAMERSSHDVVRPDGFRPNCWVLAAHLFSLRAPPARAS